MGESRRLGRQDRNSDKRVLVPGAMNIDCRVEGADFESERTQLAVLEDLLLAAIFTGFEGKGAYPEFVANF
jgi:hypothetical protein